MVRIREPRLEFAFGQQLEDPRDGLTMFGPYDRGEGGAYGIRAGVIGTKQGIRRFGKWVESIQRPVGLQDAARFRPPFPGFEAVFQIAWNPKPALTISVDPDQLDRLIRVDDKYKRIYGTVDFFASKLIEAKTTEEEKPDIWFVVIPDDLGVLKGNIGNQNYSLGSDLDLAKYRAVSIWCKRFSVNFGAAALRPTEASQNQ